MTIQSIEQDIFIKRTAGGLMQMVRVAVRNDAAPAPALLLVRGGERDLDIPIAAVPSGCSTHEVFIDELTKPRVVEFALICAGTALDVKRRELCAPRHWLVHVVQLSHHDWGYTDIPSNVMRDHCRWLDQAVDIARDCDGPDDDARFRIVLEQCWSVDHYLKTAPEHRANELVRLMREGRFELTALFGNMTTEIMGHEQLYRALYHAFALKRRYGIDIVSAEHNDITGISWGLSRALTDAGIRLLCPGLPLYYGWGHDGSLPSFWDQRAVFGHDGPGAFWWEAPSGKRLLFWCNNSGCGGDCRPDMPGLALRLRELETMGDNGEAPYPYRVLRWPVSGAARDNSPFVSGYLDTVRHWNDQWAYPHLSVSTNARFYREFISELPAGLPVHRGELPGQDYPVAASSTAAATAANRVNHIALNTAETLSCAAAAATGQAYPAQALAEAREASLYHDEHVWGFHFPCGPAMTASEYQKAEQAYRASAIAHGAVQKAIARIADNVEIVDGDFHLVVFNPTQYTRSGPVRAPLREIDNSGSQIVPRPREEDPSGSLRGVLLGDRWHANPPMELVQGRFTLLDAQTGRETPFQIERIKSHMDTLPYAAQRLGLGSGTRRYGFFEDPAGLACDLCFIAADVPACGYRTYRLKPAGEAAPLPVETAALADGCQTVIENEYYRVSADIYTGSVCSIVDKTAGRELVDTACPHGFFAPVVSDAHFWRQSAMTGVRIWKREGAVCRSIEIEASAEGLPSVRRTIRLYSGIARIYLDARVLKDAAPLMDVRFAFPLRAARPSFRYEGCLSVMNPIRDYLPGSHSDTVAVQRWVKVRDDSDGYTVMWASLDAPVASFGGFWPGYTSPAHRCVFDEGLAHPALKEDELRMGWIYSQAFTNNYGTNFSVSQVGNVLFRYVLAADANDVSDAQSAAFGAEAVTPFEPIYTKHVRHRSLPPVSGFAGIDNENILLLCMKQAEDGRGCILRLWNISAQPQATEVSLPHMQVQAVMLANAAEEDLIDSCAGRVLRCGEHGFAVEAGGNAVITLRVL